METNQSKNPLTTLWNVLGTVGGIISLSSMVGDWMGDLLKWQGFIALIIDSYRSIVEPIWYALVGWLPWSVPYWIADYLVFGLIVVTSFQRAVHTILASKYDEYFKKSFTSYLKFMLVLLWPNVFWVAISGALAKQEPGADAGAKKPFILILQWLGAILLGLVILLAINAKL